MLNDAIDFDNRPSEYAELLVALPKVRISDIGLTENVVYYNNEISEN